MCMMLLLLSLPLQQPAKKDDNEVLDLDRQKNNDEPGKGPKCC